MCNRQVHLEWERNYRVLRDAYVVLEERFKKAEEVIYICASGPTPPGVASQYVTENGELAP